MSRVMAEVRARATADLGDRTSITDAEILAIVEDVLQRAVNAADRDALVLSELLAGRPELNLQPVATIRSHRSGIGPLVVFVKRRLLQPLSRWLYEYSMDNFERQARINRVLFAAIQALAVENARLRKQGPGAK